MIYLILIVTLMIGVKMCKYDGLSIALTVFSIVGLIIVFVGDTLAPYEYERFVRKRDSFEDTLKASRESGNTYESAAIVKEVAEWNEKLAGFKYSNTTIFERFTDDRFMDLKPIK